ncbi:splicing factor Cactin-like [Lolium perenne]|uniref:splicing factor Cactin-like n=1 Tax=Lolium perenne TaxID=4522 RepID=UPI0021EB282B|nr:cactin-like [Lolium perenne]
MAKPHAASPAREAARPSRSLAKAVSRRAAAVSQKLAARGLGAFVWHKKLDRDLGRGLLPDIVSLRSERRRCLARRKEAAAVSSSAASRRVSPPPPITAASFAKAEEEAKEAAFLLDQSRIRAETRFGYGRPKPIDVLVKSLDGTRPRAVAAFRGASLEGLRELGKEIAEHAGLDRANGPFWDAAKVLCDAEVAKAAGTAGDGERLVHSAIFDDVKGVVEGKSIEELDAMQETITARMAAGEAMVVEHWQGVTELIRVEKDKKYLQQNYSTCDDEPASSDNKDDEEEPESADDGGDMADTDDAEGSDALCQVALPQTPSALELRKPKYITRVRSGFEWSKYNRVHYDHDQPPPKIVKGYKFVVYYPDLAGTKPPEYTVHKDGESDETCIIRFHAGPPYEDVAFRIVNKEWEYSRKGGFKCTFERGILHLNFHFKRFFYRR